VNLAKNLGNRELAITLLEARIVKQPEDEESLRETLEEVRNGTLT
jgi:hypothetical protein